MSSTQTTLPDNIRLGPFRKAGEQLDVFDILVDGTVVKTMPFSTARIMGNGSEEWIHAEAHQKAKEWLVQNRYLEGPLRERPLTYKMTYIRSEQLSTCGPSSPTVRTQEFEVEVGQDLRQKAAQEWQDILRHGGDPTFYSLELVEHVDWKPQPPQKAAA